LKVNNPLLHFIVVLKLKTGVFIGFSVYITNASRRVKAKKIPALHRALREFA